MQQLNKLLIGEDVQECLTGDLDLEPQAHPVFKEAIAYYEQVGDYVSRELLDAMLKSEEEHIDWPRPSSS